MQHLRAQIDESAVYVSTRWNSRPRCGIILGSGLGSVGESIDLATAIDYGEIPHFQKSTAVGHKGRFLCGRLAGVPVMAMQGRFHCYEGYSAERATFPVRVMKALGVELLIVSNAAGGLNPNYACGDIMVIDDHINLINRNPLVGVNDDQLGPRFPDMSSPYDRRLGDRALTIARQHDFVCHRGVYIAMLVPTYKTRAEIRMTRYIGGDAVGMSTVPEAIVAAHANLRVLGLSTITNVCSPDKQLVTSGHAVIQMAETAREKLQAIVTGIVTNEFNKQIK